MAFKDKLPVSYLLFTNRGRINRRTYWTASIFIWTSFYILFFLLNKISYSATWVIYPILFWALISTATKRLHDINKSAHWLWAILIPILGPIVLGGVLGFKKGNKNTNHYGKVPGTVSDYFKNENAKHIEHLKTEEKIVDDVSQLNPILVAKVVAPYTIKELQTLVRNTDNPISIGGGRFSMGGQTASPRTTHIDMRNLNKVIEFSPNQKTIKVEAGIRWCDIQKVIDEHNLSIKIMQTYANFTVGGSISVNCHGRYIGLGAVILSVKSIELILPNGEMTMASKNENVELFNACVGCYNAIGIITKVELDLSENITVKRIYKTMKTKNYFNFFKNNIRENEEIVFHNADLYAPHFKTTRAVSWIKTNEKPSINTRLMTLSEAYPIERYFINAFSKSNFGKWRREHIIDPILYLKNKVHWRNYEAGYDVAELEPESRKQSTYILQEYFVPINKFEIFNESMSEIFNRHKVNVLNVSIRHAHKDTGSMLAWAREEVFAFVVWYKQSTSEVEKNKVGVWTRELIDAAILLNGAYYLPYQVHATKEQFMKAYPDAEKLMKLKNKLDPNYRFRNVIWDAYYK